jgi:hypothetical protein
MYVCKWIRVLRESGTDLSARRFAFGDIAYLCDQFVTNQPLLALTDPHGSKTALFRIASIYAVFLTVEGLRGGLKIRGVSSVSKHRTLLHRFLRSFSHLAGELAAIVS